MGRREIWPGGKIGNRMNDKHAMASLNGGLVARALDKRVVELLCGKN